MKKALKWWLDLGASDQKEIWNRIMDLPFPEKINDDTKYQIKCLFINYSFEQWIK